MIPMPPSAALTPIPAFAPVDKPPEACGPAPEEPSEVDFEGTPDVGVATFHPSSPMALIDEDEDTVIAACAHPPENEPIYVRTCPDVTVDKHVPSICPGSPF
jgi:hypothetical protein